jgi:ParB family chromosome partitioning protein
MKETVISVPVKELHDFPDNPFSVGEDIELQDSIRDYGVISPLVVRPREVGGYEIISGHRRKAACEKAGIATVPAFVREMNRDAAVIALVDSNLHREHILPSEKARAYKMKLEAIRRQGERNDLKAPEYSAPTSRRFVGKLESADTVGLSADESGRNVQRYIRLTELIPPILGMVDEGKIAFSQAVELSYLPEKEQRDLLTTMESEERTPSLSQAQRMKRLSAEGGLDMDAVFNILTEEKPNQKEQLKLSTERIIGFFPKSYTVRQMEETILKLLADWQKKRERQRNDAR